MAETQTPLSLGEQLVWAATFKQERLSAKVSILRTMMAYIARGDDMAGPG